MAAAEGSAVPPPDEEAVGQPQSPTDHDFEPVEAPEGEPGSTITTAPESEVVTDPPDLGTVPESSGASGNGVEPPPPEVSPEKKAEAAKAEASPGEKRVTYKVGDVAVDLQLPPKLLASMKFRIGALDDDDLEILRVIKRLIGDAEYEKVMNAMDEAGLVDEPGAANRDANTSFGNLVNDALSQYGMSAGESPASTNS